MNRPGWTTRATWQRWAVGLAAGVPLAALGCTDLPQWPATDPMPLVRSVPPSDPTPAVLPVAEASAAPVPISLDAVLRLAEGQNPSVALARERVNQAAAEQALAAKRWLPDLYVGAAYYRHEGAIQLQEGPVITSSTGAMFGGAELNARLDLRQYAYQQLLAARKHIQQQGELKRITSETLLDAANTYVDLLAARSAIAIAMSLDEKVADLLKRAEKVGAIEHGKGIDVEIVRLKSERIAQQQTIRQLQAQADSASAKLVYLLGLGSCSSVEPLDAQIVQFPLVPAEQSCQALVAQALSRGPGVQELEQLLGLIQQAQEKAKGPGRLLPVVQVQAAEGAFGGGAGADMTFNNRLDLGVQVRWNLTEHLTAAEQKRVASSQACQAQLAYRELQGKLALGVQQARETILAANDQLRQAEELIGQAREAKRLSEVRLKNNLPNASYSEVLAATKAEATAQDNYVNVLRDYDKAQVRLLVLTGGVGGCCPPGPRP